MVGMFVSSLVLLCKETSVARYKLIELYGRAGAHA
jgi:hypothetical protein